jgi:hypothetical protein
MQLLPAKQEYALDDGTTGRCRLSLRVEPMARYFRKVTPSLSSTVRPAPAFTGTGDIRLAATSPE